MPVNHFAFDAGRHIDGGTKEAGRAGEVQEEMAGAHGLPHRHKAADHFEKVLMRYPDANGILRQNTQGWAQPASLFHQHPARQSLLFRLAGKLMDGSTRRVRNRDPNRPIPKRRIVEPGESDFKGGNLITHDLPVHLILHGLVKKISGKAARSEVPEAYLFCTLRGSSD